VKLKLAIDVTEEGKFVAVYLYQGEEIISMSPAFKSVKEAMDFAEYAIRDILSLEEDSPLVIVYDSKDTRDDDMSFRVDG
jgi:hypothetical protein